MYLLSLVLYIYQDSGVNQIIAEKDTNVMITVITAVIAIIVPVFIVFSFVYLMYIIHDSEAFVKPTRKFLIIFPMENSETVKYGCYLCVNRSLRVLRGYCPVLRGVSFSASCLV